ncbi:tannase/feruloyl esterase family alpha/beta hydrolase [Roseomonas sp. BN140053]|uniref:tannase/feruloyl esterase family alpha/beta hydrolase n=1 Tax=Roseomonas sp. BN140053 TaxID=3391898 RepID=UPI0039E8E858
MPPRTRRRAACLGFVASLLLPAAALAQGSACTALAAPGLFPNTAVSAARDVPAEGATPAHCEVTAMVRPVEGSSIGVVVRLPENWNGRLLGIGGGGFAGDVRLDTMRPALARGYAVAGTDAGHPSADSLDPSWALRPDGQLNREAVTDFGHRAVHEMTVLAKQVVAHRYGRPQDRTYWQGCSTGGRQGLAEVQRYPEDYDGVIAGAPVYNMVVYSSAILRTQFFHAAPGNNLTPAQVPLVAAAVQRACDRLDGVADGVLTDPRRCSWDPAELRCTGNNGPDCLTDRQVETVRKMYAGVTTADGRVAAAPSMRGGELDWLDRSVGTRELPLGRNAVLGAPFISYLVENNPRYDLMSYDPERDQARIESSFAASQIVMNDAEIAPFLRRGGKLLLWHGFNDPGPSPTQTVAYLDRVTRALGGEDEARGQVRLFLAPGVFHCRGGPGPDQFDTLSALEAWVERGVAPERIVATKANSPVSRPLCPYPLAARYDGSGDPNDANSFRCAPAGG